MDTPSACWRRSDNLPMTSLAYRKQGELGKQSFWQQDTEFSALAKKERKAVKDCMGLVWLLGKRFADTHQLIGEPLMSMRFELTCEQLRST